MIGRMTGFISRRYDFERAREPTRSYIVASSYRCGSTFLCRCLWETGVMGAPWEYLNFENDMRGMMGRLESKTTADYISKLVRCRTSRNGVFGIKAHFHHFEAALKSYPRLLDVLPDPVFIYIERKDRVAQAVSMAKAIQTNAWLSLAAPRQLPLFYSPDFVSACVDEVDKQVEGWARWFEKRGITPVRLSYETLMEDRADAIARCVALLKAERDEGDTVVLPNVERQADATNSDWISRYIRDTSDEGRSFSNIADDSADR